MQVSTSPRPAPAKRYYGWHMVVIGSVINSIGSINGAISSVFFLPLTQELGIGRGALATALSLARLESGIIGPLGGWMLDKKGPRLTITVGCLLGGFGLIVLPFADSLFGFLLVYMALISVGFNIGFILSMHQVANIWFAKYRTRVLSIFSFSIRFGRALFVPILAFVVAKYGWRTGAVLAGITVIAVVLPLSFFIKRSPEAIGQHPDGAKEPPKVGVGRGHGAHEGSIGRDFTFKEALKTTAYWVVVFSTITRLTLGGAVQGQLIPMVVDEGMSSTVGAGLLSVWALAASGLLLVVGYLADKWSKKPLLIIGHVSITIGLLILVFAGGNLVMLTTFVLLAALAESMAPANHSIIGDLFGRAAFGRLNGMLSTFGTVGIAASPFLGFTYDHYGNYDVALIAFAGIAGTAAVLVTLFLHRPKPPEQLQ